MNMSAIRKEKIMYVKRVNKACCFGTEISNDCPAGMRIIPVI